MWSTGRASAAPLISVVMANYQAGEKIVAAIESVLRQSLGDLELIVCDDASTDNSTALVEQFMRTDPRVSLIRSPANGGPARCRNRGLEAARGSWIAIVDADDIIHPERFERLLAAASHGGVDIVADDLLHFYEDGSPATLLLDRHCDTPFEVSAAQWIGAGLDGTASLGYLKPVIRATALGTLRYDESLRIGEDYDLVLRLLLEGTSMAVFPEPFYLYRRHSGSISHRLSGADLTAMIDSQRAMTVRLGALPESIAAAFAARDAKLSQGRQFEALVKAIKGRTFGQALSLMLSDPSLILSLMRAFFEGRRRKAVTEPAAASQAPLDLGPDDVPEYVAAASVDWTAPRPRQVWIDLANTGRGLPVDVVCSGPAARYAAGFIPLANIREPVGSAKSPVPAL